MAVLGIDTSCYRTSLALAGEGAVLAQRRRLLEVPSGGRGLRQSDGLFQHVKQLGEMAEELFAQCPLARVEAVCVSTRPRPIEGSYMPVFMAGEMAARSIAAACRVPLYETSHQQGHLRAALLGAGMPSGDFLAVHLSGGTTELLRVTQSLQIELLGGSSDLHAGQLVDRVGVKMGLGFPAGPYLEEMAARGRDKSRIPTANRALSLSFSGAEAQAFRMLDAGENPDDVAREVYSLIARSLAKLIAEGARRTSVYRVLLAGGVASSALLRSMLPERLERLGVDMTIYWASQDLSGDNAAGVALIGEKLLREEQNT